MTVKIRKTGGIPDQIVDPWSGGPSTTDKSREINIKKPKLNFLYPTNLAQLYFTECEIGLIV